MRAFVFSGGGNLGPIQVGALRALLEHDIYPDMLVGCSAGALNAAYLAHELSLQQTEKLGDVWREATPNDIYPNHKYLSLWRFIRGKDSLFDNRNFYAFLQRQGYTPTSTFEHFQSVPLYITATHLLSGRQHVFGDNPRDHVLDALMASTALTPLHPPWEIDGEQYIDGGAVTPLPLRVALERGATEIYSLHIAGESCRNSKARLIKGVSTVLNSGLSAMFRSQAQQDLKMVKRASGIKLHDIHLAVTDPPDVLDFSQTDQLIERGYKLSTAYLSKQFAYQEETTLSPFPWWQRTKEHLRQTWHKTLALPA